MFASEKIEKGSPFIRIPEQLLITADTAINSETFNEALEMVQGIDDDIIIMLFLLHERGKKKRSRWARFFHSLEENRNVEMDLPIGWEDAECLMFGETSEVYCQVREQKDGLQDIFEQLFPALYSALPDIFTESLYTWNNFVWAAKLLETHSIQINTSSKKERNEPRKDDEEEANKESNYPTTAVCPLSILPRHHPFAATTVELLQQGTPEQWLLFLLFMADDLQISTRHQHNITIIWLCPLGKKNWLVFSSLVDIEQGKEIFYSFGRSLSNNELITRQGKVLRNNYFDTVPLHIAPRHDLSRSHLLLLQKNNLLLNQQQQHLLRKGPLSKKLVNSLRIFCLPEEAVSEMLTMSIVSIDTISTTTHENREDELPIPHDLDDRVAMLLEEILGKTLQQIQDRLQEMMKNKSSSNTSNNNRGNEENSRRKREAVALAYLEEQHKIASLALANLKRDDGGLLSPSPSPSPPA